MPPGIGYGPYSSPEWTGDELLQFARQKRQPLVNNPFGNLEPGVEFANVRSTPQFEQPETPPTQGTFSKQLGPGWDEILGKPGGMRNVTFMDPASGNLMSGQTTSVDPRDMTGAEFYRGLQGGMLRDPSNVNLSALNRWLNVGHGAAGESRTDRERTLKAFTDLTGLNKDFELERIRGQTARDVATIGANKESDTLKRGAQRDVAARRSQLRKELSESVQGWKDMDATTQNSLINQNLLEEFQGMDEHLALIPRLPTKENQVTVGPKITPEGPQASPAQRVYSDPKIGTRIFGASVQGGKLNPEAMRAALAGPEALRGLTDADLDLLAEQIQGATGGGMSAAQDLGTFLTRLAVASGKMNLGGLPITETRGGATGGYNVGGEMGMWFPGQRVRTLGGLLQPGFFGAPSPEQMTGTDLQGRVLGRLFRRIYGQ